MDAFWWFGRWDGDARERGGYEPGAVWSNGWLDIAAALGDTVVRLTMSHARCVARCVVFCFVLLCRGKVQGSGDTEVDTG